jgi:hypothetical protein
VDEQQHAEMNAVKTQIICIGARRIFSQTDVSQLMLTSMCVILFASIIPDLGVLVAVQLSMTCHVASIFTAPESINCNNYAGITLKT